MRRSGPAALLALLAATPFLSASARPSARIVEEFPHDSGNWTAYCQVWKEPRRIECEAGSRLGSATNPASRILWFRSSAKWLDGLRFRLDATAVDVSRGIRLWVDRDLFRPEFACKPFAFDTNTCSVADAAANRDLVNRLMNAETVSAVGQDTAGAKVEVRFRLKGFREAVEHMERVRAAAEAKFSEPAPIPPDSTAAGR